MNHEHELSTSDKVQATITSTSEELNPKFCNLTQYILNTIPIEIMALNSDVIEEAEIMVDMLDFARCHGRKLTEDQAQSLCNERAQSILLKLSMGEYLTRVEKEGTPLFYTLTSKGLNLFEDMRKDQSLPLNMKHRITENLIKAMADLEIKPWEVMFHIIHLVGKKRPVTTEDIEEYFTDYFGVIKGTSRSNIYRNLKHLRMKGYIEYEKKSHLDQSQYRLSRKGEEIFYMTKIDAARKLRTSAEWDAALKKILGKVAKDREEDNRMLFHTLETVLPHGLSKSEVIWALYTQGSIWELKGDLDRAEAVYLRMEGICEETGDSRGRAYALKGLGNVSFKRSNYVAAEQYYRRCQRIAGDFEDNALLSDVFNNMGSCFYMNDDIDDALQAFEKGLSLAGNDTYRVAGTLYNTGLCYARKEDLIIAKKLWEKSLHLYKELQESVEIKKVRSNLREIDQRQKKDFLEEKYREALETGTSEDIRRAYDELVEFEMDFITVPGE
ncbi:MAG: tetratricopeptide repeat protein [Theionarchaea archaeon]|nr:tetratricopeptide repeat protein [Theionarchaea archaeon]